MIKFSLACSCFSLFLRAFVLNCACSQFTKLFFHHADNYKLLLNIFESCIWIWKAKIFHTSEVLPHSALNCSMRLHSCTTKIFTTAQKTLTFNFPPWLFKWHHVTHIFHLNGFWNSHFTTSLMCSMLLFLHLCAVKFTELSHSFFCWGRASHSFSFS